MDIVFIEGLTAEAIIGCLAWERRVKQKLVLDIEMNTDCQRAAQTDAIAGTLDYAAVSDRVLGFIQESSFQLIETLAENVAKLILQEFSCQQVKIRLKKPGALPAAQTVGVIIERPK